jgi:hypothetical protein
LVAPGAAVFGAGVNGIAGFAVVGAGAFDGAVTGGGANV